MRKIVFIFFLIGCPLFIFSQIGPLRGGNPLGIGETQNTNPFEKKGEKDKKKNIYEIEKHRYIDSMEVYKSYTLKGDTIILDTSLSIKSYYKKNQLYKDMFGLQPLSNIGTGFSLLTYQKENFSTIPDIGFSVKDFYYDKSKNIRYYDVKTPISILDYMSTFTSGNILKSLFTANINPDINFSVSYNGIRSLGVYSGSYAKQHHFTGTLNFKTKWYSGHLHYLNQSIFSDENGGIKDIKDFISGEEDYSYRGNIPVNLPENVSSFIRGKTFFIDHYFNIIRNKKIGASISHKFSYDSKYFSYNDTYTKQSTDYYSSDIIDDNLRISDTTYYKNINNDLGIVTNIFGSKMGGYINFNSIDYSFKGVKLFDNKLVENLPKSNNMYLKLKFENTNIPNLKLKGEFVKGLAGNYRGSNYLFIGLDFKTKDIIVKGSISNINKYPDFTFLSFQSNYKKFNWNNNFDKLENRQEIDALISYKNYSLKVDFNSIKNYYYFDENKLPTIYDKNINIFSAKLSFPIKFWKFGLENDVLYQKVLDGDDVYRLPDWIIRNSFYFQHDWTFLGNKKVAFMQTGLSLYMFASYKANGYNPLYADYFLQNTQEIGNFPMVDLFINLKIRSMRIYFKIQHINSGSNSNYFSAPNQPYADFILRLGITWNFFT